MKNSGNMIIGLLIAATAGVIVGMLIAPAKGSDLRKNLKNTAGDWTDKLSDMMTEGQAQLSRLQSSIDDGMSDLKNEMPNGKA